MDKPNQLRIVKEVLEALGKIVESRIQDLPEEWDGFELRWYLRDILEIDFCPGLTGSKSRQKRYRAYKDERWPYL